jgi:transcriptional regulator PpsR
MAIYSSTQGRVEPRFARDTLGALDARVAAKVAAAGGDVAMIIDRSGFIRDMALNNSDMVHDGFESWLDRRWADTVMADSRPKIEEMLRDAANDAGPRWREINHRTDDGAAVAVRYIAMNAGEDGRIIAIGRDHRAISQLEQRLIQAQQAMEQDYRKLREAESRYRLLFQLASEAVIVVDATTRRIVEANPAADRLIGGAESSLVGRDFSATFEEQSRDAAISLLAVAQGGPNLTAQSTLRQGGRALEVAASLFRQDRASLFLVRLSSPELGVMRTPESTQHLLSVLERIPDAFVVTDENLRILAQNAAFLDLSRIASNEQAKGVSLDTILGRPEIDRNVLLSSTDRLRTSRLSCARVWASRKMSRFRPSMLPQANSPASGSRFALPPAVPSPSRASRASCRARLSSFRNWLAASRSRSSYGRPPNLWSVCASRPLLS